MPERQPRPRDYSGRTEPKKNDLTLSPEQSTSLADRLRQIREERLAREEAGE